MGFYIRKSVSAGPFRFNLSRSGLGVSVGVKGFRIGSGPRGNYVHMGRGGLYYRASLGRPRRASGLGLDQPRISLHNLPYPETNSQRWRSEMSWRSCPRMVRRLSDRSMKQCGACAFHPGC